MSCTTRHIEQYFEYTHSNVRRFVYIHISLTSNCSRLKGGGGYPWVLIVKEDLHVNWEVFWKRPQNTAHVSQQVWHDIDPFLLTSAAHEAKFYTRDVSPRNIFKRDV